MTYDVCFDSVIIFSRYQANVIEYKNKEIAKLCKYRMSHVYFLEMRSRCITFFLHYSCTRFCLLVKVVFEGVPVLLVSFYVCLLHSAAAAAACRPSNKHNSQSSRITHFTNLKLNIYLAGYMMYWLCTGQYS
jgi:hypothetical protein